MPLFPRSLASSVQRSRLLELLEMDVGPFVLPATTRCPLCSSPVLELHWDQIHRAEWAYCSECRFAGDLIELMIRQRDTSLRAVCEELIREGGLPPTPEWEVEQYERTHLRVRREMYALWSRASGRMRTREFQDLDRPLNCLGIHALGGNTWPGQLSEWIGVSSRIELEDVWHPGSYGPVMGAEDGTSRPRQRGCGPGAVRIFRGHGWDQVLLLPCTDLPGRVCGFLIIGREGDLEAGDIFYRAVPGLPRRENQLEGGILMRDQMRTVIGTKSGRVKWPGATFVCTDPVEAVSLQVSTVRDGYSPSLPLIGVMESDDTASARCWSGVSKRALVFFDPTSLETAIRAALRVDGQVGLTPAEPPYRAESVLAHVYQTRRPVLDALAVHLATLSSSGATSLIRSLAMRPEQAARLERLLEPELRTRLQPASLERTLMVDGRTILTNSHGWQDGRTRKWLVNAVIEIEELVTNYTRQMAAGRMVLEGAEYPFRIDVSAVHARGLFTVLRDQLRESGGPELFFDPRAEKIAWETAVRLSEPKRTTARDRIGWDDSTQEIVLPTGTISATGFQSHSAVGNSLEELPLQNWEPGPETLDVESELELLSIREQAVSGRLALYVTECVLAPVLGTRPRGVLVCGDVAQEYVLGLGFAMGLLTPAYPSRLSADDQVRWLDGQTVRHSVPPILDLREGRGQAGVARWLDTLGDHVALILAPEVSLLSARTQQRFDVLRLPRSWRLPRNWRSSGSLPVPLVVRWLCDLSQRKFAFTNRRPHPTHRLEQDFRDWCSANYPLLRVPEGLGSSWTMAEAIDPRDAVKELCSFLDLREPAEGVFAGQPHTTAAREKLDGLLRHQKAPPIDWNSVDSHSSNPAVSPISGRRAM